jgi:hypothetical protein
MGDCYLADIKQPSTLHNRQVFHIQSSSSLLCEVHCNLSAPSESPMLASKPMSKLPTNSPSPLAPSNEELKTSLREAFSTHAVKWDFLPNETSKRAPDYLKRGIEEAAQLASGSNLWDKMNDPTLPPPTKVINIQPKDARPQGQASLGITSLASIGHLSSLQDIEVKWDSGADITLILKNCLTRLAQPPKVTEGMKIQLYKLMGKSKITGCDHTPVCSSRKQRLSQTRDGGVRSARNDCTHTTRQRFHENPLHLSRSIVGANQTQVNSG